MATMSVSITRWPAPTYCDQIEPPHRTTRPTHHINHTSITDSLGAAALRFAHGPFSYRERRTHIRLPRALACKCETASRRSMSRLVLTHRRVAPWCYHSPA